MYLDYLCFGSFLLCYQVCVCEKGKMSYLLFRLIAVAEVDYSLPYWPLLHAPRLCMCSGAPRDPQFTFQIAPNPSACLSVCPWALCLSCSMPKSFLFSLLPCPGIFWVLSGVLQDPVFLSLCTRALPLLFCAPRIFCLPYHPLMFFSSPPPRCTPELSICPVNTHPYSFSCTSSLSL